MYDRTSITYLYPWRKVLHLSFIFHGPKYQINLSILPTFQKDATNTKILLIWHGGGMLLHHFNYSSLRGDEVEHLFHVFLSVWNRLPWELMFSKHFPAGILVFSLSICISCLYRNGVSPLGLAGFSCPEGSTLLLKQMAMESFSISSLLWCQGDTLSSRDWSITDSLYLLKFIVLWDIIS